MSGQCPWDDNICREYFGKYGKDDFRILYLRGVRFCANSECPKQTGNIVQYDGEGPVMRRCGAVDSSRTLEQISDEMGILRVHAKFTQEEAFQPA